MEELNVQNIKQGELYFGHSDGFLKTLLGSCVAIVLWNQENQLGGMCHIVLPDSAQSNNSCDDRFADCVVDQFAKKVKDAGTLPREYWVGVYGGGNMFPAVHFKNDTPIGEKNIHAAYTCLKKHGFKIVHEDIGGAVYRMLILNMQSGEVVLRNTDIPVIQSVPEK